MVSTLTDEAFLLPGLEPWRRSRTERLANVLGSTLDTSNPSGHAIAHHLLEGAEQAAHDRDAALLAWYRRIGTRDLACLLVAGAPRSAHVLLTPTKDELLRSPLSETAYYLVRPDTASAEKSKHKLLVAALDSAAEYGFGPLLEQHAPVVCLLEHRDLADTLFSWSITRLPGTVFTDCTNHPEVLARDLIHEAGHHWLNDALAFTEAVLPDEVTFYSPWRATQRPVFGFLQACWAFSLTMRYSACALEHSTPPAHTFLAGYLSNQRKLLRIAASSFTEASNYIEAGIVRERLIATVEMAMHA